MTKTYMDYEFFKQTQSEKWKPQPKHYKIRFVGQVVFGTFAMWLLFSSMILILG